MRSDAAVFVLEREDLSRIRLVPRMPVARRRNAKLTMLVGIVAAHVGAAYLFVALPAEIARPVETDSLIAVNIRPQIVVSRFPIVLQPPIRLPKDIPVSDELPIPDFARPTLVVLGVGTMPPQPVNGEIDSSAYARGADIAPGRGATVVLRIEVLDSGDVGRVEVDVSGGTDDIDRAAIAYARSIQWIGGMVDGRPAAMWIRWGVRLERPADEVESKRLS